MNYQKINNNNKSGTEFYKDSYNRTDQNYYGDKMSENT